jgi:hypothetical protein
MWTTLTPDNEAGISTCSWRAFQPRIPLIPSFLFACPSSKNFAMPVALAPLFRAVMKWDGGLDGCAASGRAPKSSALISYACNLLQHRRWYNQSIKWPALAREW